MAVAWHRHQIDKSKHEEGSTYDAKYSLLVATKSLNFSWKDFSASFFAPLAAADVDDDDDDDVEEGGGLALVNLRAVDWKKRWLSGGW